MTIGELARLFNEDFGIGADLEVVPMEGWRREMYHDETGLPWVMPSPNMPTLDTAVVYPGTVLFEGTNVSEGRGTTRPFELVGAPWVVGGAVRRRDERAGAAGRPLSARPCSSRPSTSTRRRAAAAARFTCSIARRSAPVETGVALLAAFRAADPARFAWREPPYEYEHEKLPIDILAGSSELREQIERGMPAREIADSWKPAVAEFERVRERFLLY